MRSVWGRMWAPVCVLLLAAWVVAEDNPDRHSKLPFIADAVGNTLPPPSNVPATVGSPVNLLTPDRYEFYTFDESGELVKRLMTLEEIQAIVAAGEETDGLVTFANENHPTITFNFSQPPYTKVHNVVSNVQNVLKAQMEAHKNKPPTQPPLDTPDVSDSWSLILPSIFGNTGVDIVPDKTSGFFITPETDTFELDPSNFENENSLGKEGINTIALSSTTEVYDKILTEKATISNTAKEKVSTTTSRTTTAAKRRVPTTTTTISTIKPRTTTTTTIKTPTSTSTTRSKPAVTTSRPIRTTPTQHRRTTVTTTTTTTVFPTPEKLNTIAASTRRPIVSKPSIIDDSSEIPNTIPLSFGAVLDSRKPVQYEKISTFVPISTPAYIIDKTTRRPLGTTKISSDTSNTATKKIITTSTTTAMPKIQSTTNSAYTTSLSYLTSMVSDQEYDKINSTTITTQSVSPSTTVSSTEFISMNSQQVHQNNMEKDHDNREPVQNENHPNNEKDNESNLPMFDVAQSISQIASDLGGTYAPVPTSNDLVDTSKVSNTEVESKENLEIEIPIDNENEKNSSSDNFIKISTLDPHEKNGNKTAGNGQDSDTKYQSTQKESLSASMTLANTSFSTSTTIDPILSESMEDLLSQVVNSAPETIVSNQTSDDIKQTITQSELKKDEIPQTSNVKFTPGTIPKTDSSTLKTDSSSIVVKENNEKYLSLNNTKKFELIEKNNENKKDKLNLSDTDNIKNADKYSKNQSPDLSKNSSTIGLTEDNSGEDTEKQPDMISTKEKDEVSHIYTTSKNYKEESLTSTESLPKLELTTVKLGSTIRQQDENISFNAEKNNILTISESNKLTDNNQKEKESAGFPKLDEFKKKIQKVNIDDKELANERNNSWKLISTVSPPKANEIGKEKNDGLYIPETNGDKNINLDFSKENQGLEVTTKDLGEDIAQFTELCNELAFQYWNDMLQDKDKKRSFVLSPYSITSMLAMMFMGARGATSGEMNEILKLDDMVTFNPHFTLKNISDSIETSSGSGVAISAFIRELYSDRSKGKILTFYKERAQHFYNGHVEEINFKLISDIIRRRTNLLVKRYTWGKIIEYIKSNTIVMNPPLAAFSTNIFQTDCSSSSVDGRDGEMYFVVSPNVRQRRLVPVPAVVYRSNFLAGYDPVLDATAAALGNTNSVISTLFLMPGQQGNVVHADDLEALEKRLLDSNPTTPTWNRLLRTLLPRVGLELQIPRFSHKSIFNVSSTLRRMGLKDLFDQEHADLGGLNGPSKDLYLSDMIQTTTFVTCGEGVIAEQHHIEEYPETLDLTHRRRTARWITGWDEPRDYQRAFHDPHDVGDAMHLPLHLRPRQARLPSRNVQPARLKFDRPFLFFVRHNPSGMILYVGRYNPRLLP